VRVKLYKGTVLVSGRSSKDSLFDPSIATFEDEPGRLQSGRRGRIHRLNALRMRIAARRGRK